MRIQTTSGSLKKWLLGLSFLGLAGFGVAVWLAGGFSREPLHKGEPISFWVNRSMRLNEGLNFTSELQAIGPACVPYLIKKLRTQETWGWKVREFLWEKLPSRLRRNIPQPENPNVAREYAAGILATFGSAAQPAIRDLTVQLDDSYPQAATWAAHALGGIGPPASNAVPNLVLAARRSAGLMSAAAQAVWKISRATNLVLQVLTNAVAARGQNDVMLAASALGGMGAAASPAAPFLLNLLDDGSVEKNMRSVVARALGEIGASSPRALAALEKLVHDPDPVLRFNAARSLWQIDHRFAQLAATVAANELESELLSSISPIELLAELGTNAFPAIPKLKQMAERGSTDLRFKAAAALAKITNAVVSWSSQK